jgi:alginate O-acetyltransferase complex protein AlgI
VSFASFDFLAFFVVVWIIQRLLPHRPRNRFLLAASCFFYGCWNWKFLGLLWVTICTDYFVSRRIEDSDDERTRRRLLSISCAVNLSILSYFKYADFFVASVSGALHQLGFPVDEFHLGIVLPVGISFYTFQSMSYTIDVYRRRMPALRHLLDYALFVTIFPQLVAGPIERGAHLAAQIARKTIPTWPDIQEGSWLVLKGLFKKTVMADNLAVFVDQIFSSSTNQGMETLLGTYAFAFQIYGDFAGYTDIARGVGKFLGYDFMLNFRRPYLATDPSDFWQRWHISLSSWLRDYLYIPLGGNRGSTAATCRNLMITMLLGGLWHGAAWNFILWGAYHGLLLTGFRLIARKSTSPFGSLRWCLQVFVMFHLSCFGWLIFRVDSLTRLRDMVVSLGSSLQFTQLCEQTLWSLTVFCIPVMIMQLLEESCDNAFIVRRLSIVPRTVVYVSLALAVLTLGSFGGREFIYFQF